MEMQREAAEESSNPAELLAQAGMALDKFLAVVSQDGSVPAGAKKAFSAAQSAFSQGAQMLTGGGQEPNGAASMEAGVSGAEPMSMRGPR